MTPQWTGFLRRALGTAAILAALPGSGEAKVLCVRTTGSNTHIYTAINDLTNVCWQSIGRAAWGSTNRLAPNGDQAAQPGDVVKIYSGTYATQGNLDGGGGGRFDVALNPANTGTAPLPIRFEAVGTVVLTYLPDGSAGPMIGANGRNHIHWSGFTISEVTAPSRSDTGPVVFFDVTGGLLENSTLTGARVRAHGDNYTGVRLEDASGVRIANNIITGFDGSGTGDENHTGIENYRSYPVIIENNFIANCGSGIYMKAVHTGTLAVDTVIIRRNFFEGSRTQVRVLRMPMQPATPMLIYQNIFHNWTESGMWWNVFDNGPTDPTWIRVFNNTFVGTAGVPVTTFNFSVFKPNTNGLFANNIVYGGDAAVRKNTSDVVMDSTKDRFDFDRNVYFAFTASFGLLAEQNRNLAFWQGLGQDLNSMVANPMFVDVAAGNYRLRPGSPAATTGRARYGIGGPDGTVIPAGAYITGTEIIGPGTSGLPATVMNLRITPP